MDAKERDVAQAELLLQEATERLKEAQLRKMVLQELLTEAQAALEDEKNSEGDTDEELLAVADVDNDSQEVNKPKKMQLQNLAAQILRRLPEQTGYLDDIISEGHKMGYEINRTSLQSTFSRKRNLFYPLAAGTGKWTLADSEAARQDQAKSDGDLDEDILDSYEVTTTNESSIDDNEKPEDTPPNEPLVPMSFFDLRRVTE